MSSLFDARIKKYQEKILEIILDVGSQKGVNPKYSRISYNLLIHGKLTQEELIKLTGFSRASISTYLTVMEGLDVVNKTFKPGTHEYSYSIKLRIEDLMPKSFQMFLVDMNNLKEYLKSKEPLLQRLVSENKKGALTVSKRINDIKKVIDIYNEVLTPEISRKPENKT